MRVKIAYGDIFFSQNMIRFILKLFLVICAIKYATYSIESIGKKDDSAVPIKLYLKGLIVNPEALIISYERNISNGKVSQAKDDLRLAISLLESGGFSAEKVKLYKQKLLELN